MCRKIGLFKGQRDCSTPWGYKGRGGGQLEDGVSSRRFSINYSGATISLLLVVALLCHRRSCNTALGPLAELESIPLLCLPAAGLIRFLLDISN